MNYGKVYTLGHRHTRGITNSDVVWAQEKIDGSQLEFYVENGKLFVCTRSRVVPLDVTERDQFRIAVDQVTKLHSDGLLIEGYHYYGEYLQSPRHNVLSYNRVPKNNIALFDVRANNGFWYTPQETELIAEELGIEACRWTKFDMLPSKDEIKELVEQESQLRGVKSEGVVFKTYNGPVLIKAKYVRSEFKEKMTGKKPKEKVSIIDHLIMVYSVDARYQKAYQHAKEAGELTGDMKDIPVLMKYVGKDLKEENEEEIKQALYNGFRKTIFKGVSGRVAPWYKNKLMEDMSEETKNS